MQYTETHKDQQCIYVLLYILNPIFIELASQIVQSCPSRAPGFNLYTLDRIYLVRIFTLSKLAMCYCMCRYTGGNIPTSRA